VKTIIEIFRKAFKEWKDHKVLASKDRLILLSENISQLNLTDEEWLFLIKSSFSVYWFDDGGNRIIKLIDKKTLIRICMILLNDESIEIVKESIRLLGRLENKDFTLILKNIIESKETNDSVKECAVDQFWWNITDDRMLETLKTLFDLKGVLKSVSRQFMHLEKILPGCLIMILIKLTLKLKSYLKL